MNGLDSILVAKYIIMKCNDNAFVWNKTKIQKLLYVCHGICLALENKPLLKEELSFMPHGPVSLNCLEEMDKNINLSHYGCNFLDIQENIRNIIDSVVVKFGSHSANALSEWSHEVGSPWDKARLESGGCYGANLEANNKNINYIYKILFPGDDIEVTERNNIKFYQLFCHK
jgi:uncharacterized phage-associated protein